ncbi:hypothetical protein AB1I63_01390 [Streptococcus pneumoniae]
MKLIIFQMAILIISILYILASLSFKSFKGKVYRACVFIFILAGLVSYAMRALHWFDFFGVIVPLMILYQFEDRFNK